MRASQKLIKGDKLFAREIKSQLRTGADRRSQLGRYLFFTRGVPP